MKTRPTETRHNEPWLERSIALLDQSITSLDGATLSRLNRVRHAAIAQRRHAWAGWALGAGLAGAALALALAVGIGRHVGPSTTSTPASQPTADADALASDDNLDLYENLDFYAWLDARQQDADG